MKLQDAKREAILKQWREMVHDCRNSGQTVAAWCREHSMPVATYYRRQRLVWEQESRKLPVKSIGSQMIQAEERQLVPVNFEPVPYREAQQADAVEAAQIILRKGEWSIEIRNGADVMLLRHVLELLR